MSRNSVTGRHGHGALAVSIRVRIRTKWIFPVHPIASNGIDNTPPFDEVENTLHCLSKVVDEVENSSSMSVDSS